MLLLFKPKAFATDTDEGRTLATLETGAMDATGTMLVIAAAAIATGEEADARRANQSAKKGEGNWEWECFLVRVCYSFLRTTCVSE